MATQITSQSRSIRIINDCYLCADWKRDFARSGIHQLYGQDALSKSFLWESEDLYLTPAPGSIAVGYLILAPKHHFLSFAQTPAKILDSAEHIWSQVLQLSATLNLGPLVLFEHGAVTSYLRGAACIEHAHFHIVPSPSPHELRYLLRRDFAERCHDSLRSIDSIADSSPYIFLIIPEGIFSYETLQVPSQYLRKCIARQWGIPECWNWKTNPMTENFWKTVELFEGKLTPL